MKKSLRSLRKIGSEWDDHRSHAIRERDLDPLERATGCLIDTMEEIGRFLEQGDRILDETGFEKLVGKRKER